MKCIICHGENIIKTDLKEEVSYNNDIVYIPIAVLTCKDCGERYYDRKTVKYIEEIREKIKRNR